MVYKKVTLTDEKDVFEQLLSLFNDGWYVFTFLDFNALGIPPYMVHNILIYGIDFDSRKVQVLCYVNRQFVRASIEFEIFLEAYNSQNNNRKALTRCMKKKDKEIDFSYENYETQLMDYFRSQFSYDKISNYYCNIDKIKTDEDELMEDFIVKSRRDGGYYYGFDCYESLKQYLCLYDNPEYIDIRPYRLMWEHKKIMKDRFIFFQKEKIYPFDMSYYIDGMDKFAQSTKILFNLILKAKIKKCISIDYITERIDKIKSEEYILIKKMISEMHNNNKYVQNT